MHHTAGKRCRNILSGTIDTFSYEWDLPGKSGQFFKKIGSNKSMAHNTISQ